MKLAVAALTLSTSGIYLLVNVLVSHYVSPENYGYISNAMNMVNLVSCLATFGLSGYVLNAISEVNSKSAYRFINLFILTTWLVILGFCLVIKIDAGGDGVWIALLPYVIILSYLLIFIGFFQGLGRPNYSVSIISVVNLIKIVLLIFVSIIVVYKNNDLTFFAAISGWALLFFTYLVIRRVRRSKGGGKEVMQHSLRIFTHHFSTNLLVVLYTSTLIPVIFSAYGAKNAAIFAVFFIYWSSLNIIINLVFNNNFLVRFKAEEPTIELYNKTIRTGFLLGLVLYITAVISLPLFIAFLWEDYASSASIFISLFTVLFFRTLSASFGVFLSLGTMVRYKVIAQLVFILTLYGALLFGVDWRGFLYIYISLEALLALFYFMAAVLFSKRGLS